MRNPLTGETASKHIDINIPLVNDLPTIDIVDDRHAAVETAIILHQPPHLPLQIHEEEGDPLLVTLTANHGTLSAPSASHIAIVEGTGTGDAVINAWGTAASVNAFLDDLIFTPSPGFSGMASIDVLAEERTSEDRIGQWAEQVIGLQYPQPVIGEANRSYTNFAAQLAPVEVTATFADPTFAEAISVFERIDVAWNAESPNDSKVKKVELQDTADNWHLVWDGPTKYVGLDEFVEGFLSFPRTTYEVQAARVTFHDPDDSFYAQLDAIFLHSSLDIDVATGEGTSATIPIIVSNAPYDISLSTISFSEAADNGSASVEVATLWAADPDSASHVFTLVSGVGDDDNAAFEIQGDRLLVKAGVVLDYETRPEFTIRLQADDGTLTFEKSLPLSVADVDETVALSMVVPDIVEGGPAQPITVTRNTSVSGTETVTLWTGHSQSVQIPVSVTIPAGQWAAEVLISAIDNSRVQGSFVATIAATRIDAPQIWLPVTVFDDDMGFDVETLASLNGVNGFRINGGTSHSELGVKVNSAGDINDDGYDDVIVAAYPLSGSHEFPPDVFVVFGKAGGFDTDINVSVLNGTDGFKLTGADADGLPGFSIDAAGDINADGIDDLIVGAAGGTHNGDESGGVYVVFGSTAPFPREFDLNLLDGTNGFSLQGIASSDRLGYSVGGAGDVNGDGYDDIILGAPRSYSELNSTPSGYVIFGKPAGFPATVHIATIDGSNGFRFRGGNEADWAGAAVAGAGDLNGDGVDDLIVGSVRTGFGFTDDPGHAFVVFGQADGFPETVDLETLNGTDGFRLNGAVGGDKFGWDVKSAGDINGDGFDDIVVGAFLADAGTVNRQEGETYVVFGRGDGFSASLDVSSLNGVNGFRIDGDDFGDTAGFAVSTAGDVNGDGYDDLLIGAPHAEGNVPVRGVDEGATYLIFGKSDGFPAVFDLGSVNGTNGITIYGAAYLDFSGYAVAAAGDINGDGFDDITIGARLADAFPTAPYTDEGEAYVVFGRNFDGFPAALIGGAADDVLTAVNGEGVDVIIGGQGDDVLISDGGADILRGGQGDDVLAIPDVEFSTTRRLVGGTGNDTLRLDGSGLHLDLTSIADNRLLDIEQIDITGDGANTLTLNAREVLNLSSNSNTLLVFRSSDDTVNIGPNWISQPSETIGTITFDVFAQGAAILTIQQRFSAPDLVATSFDAVSDHVSLGQTDITFTIANFGLVAATAFETHVVWSANNRLGDSDDVVVATSGVVTAGIATGAYNTGTMHLQLDRAALYSHAVASDPAGQGIGTTSTDNSRLFLVIDIDNAVAESNEANNSQQSQLIDSDDITYFPWDKNGNGVVEPLEVLTSIQAIGTDDAASDFDGNGIVSPLEALSALQRIGYIRNAGVVQSSFKAPKRAVAAEQNLTVSSKQYSQQPSAPVAAFASQTDDELQSLFAIDPNDFPMILSPTPDDVPDADSESLTPIDWLDLI